MSTVFPGSTPYIEAAALELGVDVRVHEVQRLPALRVVSVLAAQAGGHPRPEELVEAAAPHLAVLAVASKAAEAMVAGIAPTKASERSSESDVDSDPPAGSDASTPEPKSKSRK